jgi:hypothetical protein
MDGKIWYFGPKTSSEHTTKWASLGPLKPSIQRSTRRVRAHIPIEQPTTVKLSVRGCLGGRLVRGVQGSRLVLLVRPRVHRLLQLRVRPSRPPPLALRGGIGCWLSHRHVQTRAEQSIPPARRSAAARARLIKEKHRHGWHMRACVTPPSHLRICLRSNHTGRRVWLPGGRNPTGAL